MFKTQLFTLSGVPPDRQKIMVKGGLLKDDEWGKQTPKEGQVLMMMGTADAMPVDPPKTVTVFVEDLSDVDRAKADPTHLGVGLQNLGNTCYLNSTVQCLYQVEPLRQALTQYQAAGSVDPSAKLTAAARDLFRELDRGHESLPPFQFVLALRNKFPQFSSQSNEGGFQQQDAEECWTNLLYALREKLQDSEGNNEIEKTFGIGTKLKLKCEESGEEIEESSTSYMLKCNITENINHLTNGIALGLQDDREKNSDQLGRLALFKGSSVITKLPEYLSVQLVRFFYKASVQQKAKILRKVSYTLELDLYEFCSDDLKKELEPARTAHKELIDKQVAEAKLAKSKEAKGEAAAPPEDVDMTDASSSASASLAHTGKYELIGVLTHKGRSADSGHYVAWVKQRQGWILYDDDKVIPKTSEEVLALSGGGDWHMAYLLLFKAIRVKVPAAAAAPAAAEV